MASIPYGCEVYIIPIIRRHARCFLTKDKHIISYLWNKRVVILDMSSVSSAE